MVCEFERLKFIGDEVLKFQSLPNIFVVTSRW